MFELISKNYNGFVTLKLLFTTLELAKEYAEQDFAKLSQFPDEKIQWKDNENSSCSQDFTWVVYEIEKIKVVK